MQQINYSIVVVTYNREKLLRECISRIEQQTIRADKVIIVNNASTDGTAAYLESLSGQSEAYRIINCRENVGGAGGFATGIKVAMDIGTECLLIIDDDAMLAADYMEKLLKAREQHRKYKAFAGSVIVDGKIDTYHRKMLSKKGFLMKNCKEDLYKQEYFECDIASFCGMLLDKEVIEKIGLPHADYFIWHDDTEYSLRIKKYSKFLVIPDAELIHKTKINTTTYPRRYEWRDYYAVRNRILFVREHGTFVDKIINYTDLFINVIFRNWLFGILKRDNYDWKYEKDTVRKAIKDTNNRKV